MRLSAQTLEFSGYCWQLVSAGLQAPGPNVFDPRTVSCDTQGHLYLELDSVTGFCASLMTQDLFLFGCFEIDLIADFTCWPNTAVLGFFAYPDPEQADDGSHEIDIELSRWGQLYGPCLHYSIWPEAPGKLPQTEKIKCRLNGTHTRHRFVWTPEYFEFTSFHGHSYEETIAQIRFANTRQQNLPMHIYLNLWWFQGRFDNAHSLKASITRFKYQALLN